MTSRHLLLPQPGGIGPGQTATLNLPLGPTYEQLHIELTVNVGGNDVDVSAADWADYIGDIRLIVDGNTEYEISAADQVKLNQFYNLPQEDGVLPIFLTAPWARTVGGEDIGGWGTAGGLTVMTLECEIKTGVSVSQLRVRYIEGPRKSWSGTPHTFMRRLARSFNSVGLEEVADIPKGDYSLFGLHMTTADIGHIEVEADRMVLHDTLPKSRGQTFKISDRIPQPGFTHIDLAPKRRIVTLNSAGQPEAEALPMSWQDFRLKLDHIAAPGTYEIYQIGFRGA